MLNHFLSFYYFNFRLIIVAGQETIKHNERDKLLGQYSQEGMRNLNGLLKELYYSEFFKIVVAEPSRMISCQTEERLKKDLEVGSLI